MTNTQSSTEVLKVDTHGRVRVPKGKQEEILAGYESSGMTGQQFAAYAGVKYSTLMSWVGKARRAKITQSTLLKQPARMPALLYPYFFRRYTSKQKHSRQ